MYSKITTANFKGGLLVSRTLQQASLTVIILQKLGATLKGNNFEDRIAELDKESTSIIHSLLADEKLGRSEYLLQLIQSPQQLVQVLRSLPTLETLGLTKFFVDQSILTFLQRM